MSGKTEIMNHKSRLCYDIPECRRAVKGIFCKHQGSKTCEDCLPMIKNGDMFEPERKRR